MFDIIINAKKIKCAHETLSYSDLVELVFPNKGHKNDFTVQYSLGTRMNPQGTIISNQSVEITNGMVFDVVITNNS